MVGHGECMVRVRVSLWNLIGRLRVLLNGGVLPFGG